MDSSPALVDGVVYVGSADGKIYAFGVSRPPILIDGNSQFVPANGVTKGSGTASDPYIIEGWDINASTADGICIWDTTAYFIIRNVFVYDGGSKYYGVWLSNVTNGQVLNVNTTRNSVGIALDTFSLNNVVSGNNVTNNDDGIYIWSSSKTTVSGNEVTDNGNETTVSGNGISLDSSNNNTVSGNEVTYSGDIGVYLVNSSSRNTVSGNTIISNNRGIMLDTSSNDNAVFGNTITSNGHAGISLVSSSGNRFYHNNVVNNAVQVFSNRSTSAWDDGYPSGGNYWSDYNGTDLYSGPYQNETGSDGKGDTPYVIDGNNKDNYPLMNPYSPEKVYFTNYVSGLYTNDLGILIFPDEPVELEFYGVVADLSISTVNFTISNLLYELNGTADVTRGLFHFNGTLYEGYNTITVYVSPQVYATLILFHDTSPPGIAINFPFAHQSSIKEKTHVYDGAGKLIGDEEKLITLDPNGRPIKQDVNFTDGTGERTGDLHITYVYGDGQLVRKITEFTDKDGKVTKEVVVEAGKIITIFPGPGNDFEHPSRVEEDFGRLVQVSPLVFELEKRGDVHTKYEYYKYTENLQGLIKRSTTDYTDAAGVRISDKVITYTYYPSGSLENVTIDYSDKDGKWTGEWTRTTYTYGPHPPFPLGRGRLMSSKEEQHKSDGSVKTTTIEYDVEGRPVKETVEIKDKSGKSIDGSERTWEYSENSEVVNFWSNGTGTLTLVQTRNTTYEYGFNYTLLTGRIMTVVLSDLSFDPGVREPGVVDIFVTVYGPTGNSFYATSLLDTSTFELEIPPDATDVTVIAMDEAGNTQVMHVYLAPIYARQPVITVQPQLVETHAVGTTFSVNVTVSNLDAAWRTIGIQFFLGYDDSLLQVVSVTEGPFMLDPRWNLHGTEFIYFNESKTDNPTMGSDVLVGDALLPNDTGAWTAFPDGNGTLATITFKAIKQPRGLDSPPLTISLALKNTEIVDDNQNDVPHVDYSGLFRVYPTNIGDVNFDGKVDMKDIGLVARAFGTSPYYPGTPPRWNPDYDVNGDGKIDMRDIAIVARNFGWHQT